MRIVVGYLATPGGADALALGVRLALTLGVELDLCIILPPDRAIPSLKSIGNYEQHLIGQAEGWLATARESVPDDVGVRSEVRFDDSSADGLIKETARAQGT